MPLNDLLEKAARRQAMQAQAQRDDKAATTDELSYAYAADITKAERDEEGNLIVYGKATGPDKDLDGDRCDPDWLKRAMPAWFEWGNVREMHQPTLAGIGLEMTQDDDDWYVKSKCIDPGAAKKIEEKGYKGYSIGIKNGMRQVRDGQNWIVDGEIVEISYVDRPCNPTAKLAIAKVAGGTWEPGEAEDVKAPHVTDATDHHARRSAEDGSEQADGDPDAAHDEDGHDRDTNGPGQTDPNSQTPRKRKKGKKLKISARDEMRALALITKALEAKAALDQSKLDEIQNGHDDVDGAMEAIAVIARLMMSEASDLADGQLHELYDLGLLMEAATALKWFAAAEEGQMDLRNATYSADPDAVKSVITLDQYREHLGLEKLAEGGAEPFALLKRQFTAEQRRQAAKSGAAMPGGRYPIENSEDLHNAVHALGRGKGSHAEIKRHIIARAKKLGLTDQLPEDWMSKKTPEADVVKSAEGNNTTETVEEIVKAAVAEVTKASEERIAALEAELTKVKAQPVPGGPVLLASGATAPAKDDNLTKAAELRAKANGLEPALAADYIAAAEAHERAAKTGGSHAA
ncbi:hypothetical protein [Streptomyces mirabilis]|uniref:hypothetical protein n=1 Tax=Streptomyces mirabilis TaxID=68239 RepID=UPI003686679F